MKNNVLIKVISSVVLFVGAAFSTSAAEYHGFVRGVHLNTNGLLQVYMDSDIHTASQCQGIFDTTGFELTVTSANAPIVEQWMPLLEAARQAKLEQIEAGASVAATKDPALVKIGYDVTPGGSCEMKYVYYIHWYNI